MLYTNYEYYREPYPSITYNNTRVIGLEVPGHHLSLEQEGDTQLPDKIHCLHGMCFKDSLSITDVLTNDFVQVPAKVQHGYRNGQITWHIKESDWDNFYSDSHYQSASCDYCSIGLRGFGDIDF